MGRGQGKQKVTYLGANASSYEHRNNTLRNEYFTRFCFLKKFVRKESYVNSPS